MCDQLIWNGQCWISPRRTPFRRVRTDAGRCEALPSLAENNLANTHPEWVCAVGDGLYLNPAEPAAADYVVQGVAELCRTMRWMASTLHDVTLPHHRGKHRRGAVCGQRCGGSCRVAAAEVTALVKAVHDTVKAADPTLRFGISPQGNPDNDLNSQYSAVTAWLAAGGEEQVVDYLCPQVYWGYGYTLQSGSTTLPLENIVPAWLAYPRAEGVALYFGLGAYRIGVGDGGANPDSVSGWSTGDCAGPAGAGPARSERGRLGAVPVWQSVWCGRTGAGRCRMCSAAGADRQRRVKSGGKPHKTKPSVLCSAAKCGIL